MALTLFRIINPSIYPPNSWYRQVCAFVIAASDEKEAREVAIANCLDGRPVSEQNEYDQEKLRQQWRQEATYEVIGAAAEHVRVGVVLMEHSGDT